MGTIYSTTYNKNTMPDHIPKSSTKPTFDSHLGFKSHRKERDPGMTENELRAMRIKPKKRNYCAQFYRDYMVCARDTLPFLHMFCRKELGLWKHCLHEDYILRMKEYEREKRLRIRQKKLEGKSIE